MKAFLAALLLLAPAAARAWGGPGHAAVAVLAKSRVRLRPLRGSTNDRRAPLLPKGYAEAARTFARRRLSLAGYRLHDQLVRLPRF